MNCKAGVNQKAVHRKSGKIKPRTKEQEGEEKKKRNLGREKGLYVVCGIVQNDERKKLRVTDRG